MWLLARAVSGTKIHLAVGFAGTPMDEAADAEPPADPRVEGAIEDLRRRGERLAASIGGHAQPCAQPEG